MMPDVVGDAEGPGKPRKMLQTRAEALYSAPIHRGRLPVARLQRQVLDQSTSGNALSMFISPAFAQGTGGGSDMLVQFVPILLMFVIFYFLLLRPQQQRAKAHREMVANVRRGDTVVTSGGIIGKVTKVKDETEVEVEIADNTRVRVVKATLTDVRAKGEAGKDAA